MNLFFPDRFFRLMGKSVGPAFLLIGMLVGGACTGDGSSSNRETAPDTQQALEDQKAKTAAATKAAEEAKQKADAARQAGDTAKAAEEEKKQKDAEAEAQKQQQIQNALQSASPALTRAYLAQQKVATAKNSLEPAGFATGSPFREWESEVNEAFKEATAAYRATAKAKDATSAFDSAEKVTLSANKAEAIARKAEALVSGFQSRFTLDSNAKKVIAQNSGDTSQIEPQCESALQELFQGLEYSPVVHEPNCQQPETSGPVPSSGYNCSCSYTRGGKWFYLK